MKNLVKNKIEVKSGRLKITHLEDRRRGLRPLDDKIPYLMDKNAPDRL